MSGLDLDVLVVDTGRPAALVAAVAGLVAQTVRGFRLLLETEDGGVPAAAHPAVRGALRVLEHRGDRVVVGPGLREVCTASRVLRMDDDVLLAPTALADLLAALEQAADGVVRAPVRGLLRDDRARCVLVYAEPDAVPTPEAARPVAVVA